MIKKLAASIRQYKKVSALAMLFTVLEVGLDILIPRVMADLIDKGIDQGNMNVVLGYGAVLLLSAVLALTFGALGGRYAARAACGFARNLRQDMYYRVQDFSFSNIDRFSTASIVTRLTTDVTNVQMAYQMIVRLAIRCPVLLVVAMIVSFSIHRELSLIFEYLTQHNQVSSIQVIFADTYREAAKEPAPKAEEAGRSAAPAQQQGKPAAPAQPAQGGQGGKPAQQGGSSKPAVQQPVSRVPQRKIVDTRKGGDVNLAKYDERLEDLGGERGARMERKSGKEKIRSNSQRRGGMTFSNKRRQDEAEKMRRLQLEIAKKAPVKVMIPDEISVGELASRMKKTGAEVVKCLMKNGVMASLSQIIDYDTAAIIAEEMGCKVEHEVTVTIEERLIDDHEDRPEDLVPRAPVVVVMGHVDHG